MHNFPGTYSLMEKYCQRAPFPPSFNELAHPGVGALGLEESGQRGGCPTAKRVCHVGGCDQQAGDSGQRTVPWSPGAPCLNGPEGKCLWRKPGRGWGEGGPERAGEASKPECILPAVRRGSPEPD